MSTTTFAGASRRRVGDQLEPVRAALLEEAEARAADIAEDAIREAAALVEEAEEAAEAAIARAVRRARTAADARTEHAIERARAESHRRILLTKETIRARALDAAHRAALAMREDPRYPALLDHLETTALGQLGVDAFVERDPDGVGGVVATQGERRVDYTLAALVDRALDRRSDELAGLWE